MENLVLQLRNLQQSFGTKELFEIKDLSVYENERIGIIGPNGSGKSTLLRLIAGAIPATSGEIYKSISFQYFPQISSQKASTEDDFSDTAGKWFSRFQVPQRKYEDLSGGQQQKFRLTKTLSTYTGGLLLDEPTTHLDEVGRKFLFSELQYYYGTLIFVSHDRFLLNQLATKIWEVKAGKITVYPGNYAAYEVQKEQEVVVQKREAQSFLKEKRRLEKGIQEKKEQANKVASQTKGKKERKPDRLSSSKQKDTVEKQLHKRAKAMKNRLEQLEEKEVPKNLSPIVFPQQKTVSLHHAYPIIGNQFSLKKGNNLLLKEANFQFPLGKKIAIKGENGVGKTSFLESLQQDETLLGLRVSKKVIFATYGQLDYQLTEIPESVLTFIMKQTDYGESFVRSILNHLGFFPQAFKQSVASLSGGEATRLKLALTFLQPANILILDEPTNFIDLFTIEALEKLLAAYEGTVLYTSHDEIFVKKTADLVYEIKDKKIKPLTEFLGG